MSAWNELVRAALLGTEKARLPESLLPEVLRRSLAAADASDQEAYFYKAAALSLLYERAGRLPEDTPLPHIEPAAEETRPLMPGPLASLMPELLREDGRKPELLLFLVEKLAEKGWIVPPEQLPDLLQLATVSGFKKLQKRLPEVIGERGKWLARFNPAWKYVFPPDFNSVWEEGSNAERRRLLDEMRQNEPERALELFRELMAAENNARERKELIRIFQTRPNAEETAFLESLYDALPAPKGTGKVAHQEIRRLLSEILLSSPHARMHRETAAKMKVYVVLEKQLLGLRNKLSVLVPEKEDALFCAAVMHEQFGFDHVSPLPGVSDSEFWFCELLRCLHPSAWESALNGVSWADFLGALQKAELNRKKKQMPLIAQLAQAIARTRYRKAALAFTHEFTVDDSNYFMLSALEQEEIERYILNKSQGQIAPYFLEILARHNAPWSRPFSRFLVNSLCNESAVNYHYQDYAKALSLCMQFDPAVLDDLFDISRKENRSWQQQAIRNQLVMPLIRLLELRRSIEFHILNTRA